METITDKEKCIAEQFMYGLYVDYKCKNDSVKGIEKVSGIQLLDIGEGNALTFEPYGGGLFPIRFSKPILRPMSDLTKSIIHKGYNDDKPFVPLVIIQTGVVDLWCSNQFNIDLLNLLHFDTRNLIPSGEAIDVNTLDVNPYEV